MLLGQGTVIAGRYVVERKIGEGAWGEVWLGHHANVGMRVAIKALLATKVESHDAVVRFEREAKFLGRIQSDYVAGVLDFLNDDIHGLILVMEYVEGESLADLLGKGRLDVERAIEIGCDLVAGLCDLHAARVVHRDMKPANVILRPLPDGRTRAVIIDFSLGRMMQRPGEAESSITQLTGAAMAVGTLPYMPPEQVLDSRKVTPASDVYALGAILYRCVSGNYVFTDVGDAIVARKKLTAEAPRLDTGRTDEIAQGFADVIARALRRRPEDRYTEARSMLTALTALRDAPRAARPSATEASAVAAAVERESTEKVLSPGAPGAIGPSAPSRARLAIAAIALIGVGVVLGLALGRMRWEPVPTAPVSAAQTAPAPSAPMSDDAAAACAAAAGLRDGDAKGATGNAGDDGGADDPPASSLPPVTADTPPVVRAWPVVRPTVSGSPIADAALALSTASPAVSGATSAAIPSVSAALSAPPPARAPLPAASVRPVE